MKTVVGIKPKYINSFGIEVHNCDWPDEVANEDYIHEMSLAVAIGFGCRMGHLGNEYR